jgi:hypothetical protein
MPDVHPFSLKVVLKGERKGYEEDGNTWQIKRNMILIMFLFIPI